MKKLLYILSLVLFASTSFFGCIPEEVEIDIPQAEEKLVVASQLLTDRLLVVNVSRSFSALTSTADTLNGGVSQDLLSRLLVDSALVTLSIGGNTDTLQRLGAGVFISTNTTFVPGQTYTLKVLDYLTGASVIAVEQVTAVVPLGNVSYAYRIEQVTFGDTVFRDTLVDLAFDFEDPAETNYYLFNAYRLRIPDSTALASLFTSTNTPPVAIYSDQLFNAATFRDTLSYDSFRPGDTLAVSLSNISRPYYDFLTIRQRSGTSLFTQLLKEPVTYPSNIEGGYGIFNLTIPSIQILILR